MNPYTEDRPKRGNDGFRPLAGRWINERTLYVIQATTICFRPLAGKWINEREGSLSPEARASGFHPLAGKWINEP